MLIGQSAASFSSLILGSFMCSLVLLCRYFKLDPDNIAPAVASALGDLLTLTLLGLSSYFLYSMPIAGLIVVQLGYVFVFIVSFIMTVKNSRIKGLLREGWAPLLGAMVISSCTGMILDTFVAKYRDYAMVSIAQDGIPGSVGSVYISRLSTALHEAKGHEGYQRGDGYDHHSMPSGSVASPAKGFFVPKDRATENAVKEARPRVSGVALFCATVPVLVIFILVSYVTRWVDLPALWACGFIIFFELAVSSTDPRLINASDRTMG
jgi:solute carrier family 41